MDGSDSEEKQKPRKSGSSNFAAQKLEGIIVPKIIKQ